MPAQPFDLISSDPDNAIKLVKDVVTMYYKIDPSLIESKSRKEGIVKYRHIAIYVANASLGINTVILGKIFGNSHGNIVNTKKKINGFLSWDEKLRGEIAEINKILKTVIKKKILGGSSFYYINLNEFHSAKIENEKAVILKGFSDEEVKAVKLIVAGEEKELNLTHHKEQNLYILEKKHESKERKKAEGEATLK